MNPDDPQLNEAFARLGVPIDSPPDTIRAAYRRLSRENHPDLAPGPSADTEQATLNGAYDIALVFAERGTEALTLRRTEITTLVRAAVSRELAPVEAHRRAGQITRRQLTPVRTIRTLSWVLGGFSAALFLIADRLPDFIGLFGIDTSANKGVSAMFCLLAITCAVFGLVIQQYVDGTERAVDDYVDSLDERRFCASELAKRLNYSDPERFSDADIAGSPGGGISPGLGAHVLFHRIDLLPVLLNRALDHGLIERHVADMVSPEKPDEYVLKFTPSAFRPTPPPPSPSPTPPTVEGARSSLIIIGTLAILFSGGTCYLWFALHTRWAIATAIFGLIFVLGTVGFVFEYIDAIRRGRKTGIETNGG